MEKTWPPRLGISNLPFFLIWKASGSFLASVADEKVMQKIKHRALFLKGADSKAKNKKCRICRGTRETIIHLSRCVLLKPLKRAAESIIQAMGSDTTLWHPQVSWLFGITWDGKPKNSKILPEAARAVIMLYWRVVYKHMVLKDLKKISKFKMDAMVRDLGRSVMSRILAFQITRQRFYMKRKSAGDRPNGYPSSSLVKSYPTKVAEIGKLDIITGRLKVNPELSRALKVLGVWQRFRR